MEGLTIAYVVGKLAEGAGVAVINKVFGKKYLNNLLAFYEDCFGKEKQSRDLLGKWEGVFIQESGKHKGGYKIIIEFTNVPGKDIAAGIALYWKKSIRNPTLDDFDALVITGAYEKNGYLRLDFKNIDTRSIQFGTVIASISNDNGTIAETRKGRGNARWSAVSADDAAIVHGTIKLKRKQESAWRALDKLINSKNA